MNAPKAGELTAVYVATNDVIRAPTVVFEITDVATAASEQGNPEGERNLSQHSQDHVTAEQNSEKEKLNRGKSSPSPESNNDGGSLFGLLGAIFSVIMALPIASWAVDFFWNGRDPMRNWDMFDFSASLSLWTLSDYLVFVVALVATWVAVHGCFTLTIVSALQPSQRPASKPRVKAVQRASSEKRVQQQQPSDEPQSGGETRTGERHLLARNRRKTSSDQTGSQFSTKERKPLDFEMRSIPMQIVVWVLGFLVFFAFVEFMSAMLNIIGGGFTWLWKVVSVVGYIAIFLGTVISLGSGKNAHISERSKHIRAWSALISSCLILSFMGLGFAQSGWPSSNITGFGADGLTLAVLDAPNRSTSEQRAFETYFLEGLDR